MKNNNVQPIRHSSDMITEEYVYKDKFRFQRMSKDGIWYVTHNNYIITHGQYRNDLEEWIDCNYDDNVHANMETRLEKHEVCDQCYSLEIIDINCVCTYREYKTIELEFEVCDCCGHLINNGEPADTPFNTEQFKK